MDLADRNAWLRRYYDENATVYDQWMASYDRVMLGDGRQHLCSLAVGRTIELAVGTGLNLPLYDAGLELVALDRSPNMLDIARRRAVTLGRRIAMLIGDAHSLPFADDRFDTVVATLFLSSVPDLEAATAETLRVLRPGGRLLVLDHGRSDVAPVRWAEHATSRFVRRTTGVDLRRDPTDYLPAAGFHIDHAERSRLGIMHQVLARKP